MELNSFVGGSYNSQAVTADQEETYNWYKEDLQSEGATVRRALYPTPGVEELSEFSVGPGRAHFFMNGRELAVIASTLIEISSAGVMTSRGTVAMGVNPATISSNGDGGGQLFITSGDNGYLFTLATNTLTQIAALNGIATMGDHLDGYFLALNSATSTWYISDLLDGATWSTGVDFAQRSAAPDPWRALRVSGAYVYLFGELTSEIWYNAGGSFPFAKHPSGLIPYGIKAAFSVAVSGQEILWLGTTGRGGIQAVKSSGFQPEPISDYAAQTAFGRYGTTSDAVADTYTEAGHTFYLLTFPTEGVTWAYDTETRQWHKRGTWVPANNEYAAWRPRWHVSAFGEHRMLDGTSGALYRMSLDLSLDVDGKQIRRMRRAPALVSENEVLFYSSFELDLEPGLGTATGQGSDPVVMMRMSNDGGKTWGPERMRSAGKTGEYSKRAKWVQLGSAQKRVFEVVVSDPIPWRLVNAYVEMAQRPRAARGGR